VNWALATFLCVEAVMMGLQIWQIKGYCATSSTICDERDSITRFSTLNFFTYQSLLYHWLKFSNISKFGLDFIRYFRRTPPYAVWRRVEILRKAEFYNRLSSRIRILIRKACSPPVNQRIKGNYLFKNGGSKISRDSFFKFLWAQKGNFKLELNESLDTVPLSGKSGRRVE
jgi:hypothetical protein